MILKLEKYIKLAMVPPIMMIYSYILIYSSVSVICVTLGTIFNKVKKAAAALPTVIPVEAPIIEIKIAFPYISPPV